jgi:DNA primase
MSEQIVWIAERFLQKVRQSGPENVTALCPFHTDSSPSFAMNTLNGLWLCYGCGEKGNLRQFLLRMGMSELAIERNHKTTLEEAAKAKPKPPDPIRPNVFSKDPIPENLLGLFSMCPLALLEAGFTEETLQHFQVGFDKWHMRITYPLRDLEGQLVGISGRAVEGQDARYKVYSDEYLIWDLPERNTEKRALLWNAHVVYPLLYRSPPNTPIVVVEGFKACMWVWQSGIRNVVALMGSRMSWEQKWILQRMGCPVYLMLDNNDAGFAGTENVSAELVDSLPVHLIDYDAEQPDGLSPQSVIQSVENPKSVQTVILDQGV